MEEQLTTRDSNLLLLRRVAIIWDREKSEWVKKQEGTKLERGHFQLVYTHHHHHHHHRLVALCVRRQQQRVCAWSRQRHQIPPLLLFLVLVLARYFVVSTASICGIKSSSGERCDSFRIIIIVIVIIIFIARRRRRRRRRMGVVVTSLDASRSGVGRAKVLLGKPSPRRLGRRR